MAEEEQQMKDMSPAKGSPAATAEDGSSPMDAAGEAEDVIGSYTAADAEETAAAAAAAASDGPAALEAEASGGEPGDDTVAPLRSSRPPSGTASASGSRPMSARPTSARPSSALPGSGSRPPSGSATATAAPAPAPGSAAGSRPGSSSGPAAAAAATGSSRPPSAMQEHARPPSGSPARPPSEPASAGPASVSYQAEVPPASHYIAPNLKAIDVEVEQGPGLPYRMMRVLVDFSQQDSKPYLGGFRNKNTGAAYHHAWTQTPKAKKYEGAQPKLERQTQTVKVAQRTQQTIREAATQMERPGVILDTSADRVKTPGKYQTSEERLAIVTAATRVIQRYYRGFQGRKRAAYLREKKQEREAFLREQEARAQQEAEEHRRKEIERRMHPRTAADFEILYNELEAWRLQETRKIKEAGLPKDKEQEVLQQLLHKETKLLQTIDRLKINANHENKEVRIQRTLGEMSKPKKYELKDGKKVDVHTPFTTRAKELQQLYNGLNLPMLTSDERLDVLLHVKWTVKEFDCNLTREIVDLIDREADLLNRGRDAKMLEGLRKRISSLFLNFIETPEFNPEATRFQIVPMDFEQYLFEKLEKTRARPEYVMATQEGKWVA